MSFDEMLNEIWNSGVPVHELEMEGYSGLYIDGEIIINKRIKTDRERLPILAEEYGHHLTCSENILNQNSSINKKIEKFGRKYAYKKLTNFNDIIKAYDDGYRTIEEVAKKLNVPEKFLVEMFENAKAKYGVCKDVNGRKIYFIPYIYIL